MNVLNKKGVEITLSMILMVVIVLVLMAISFYLIKTKILDTAENAGTCTNLPNAKCTTRSECFELKKQGTVAMREMSECNDPKRTTQSAPGDMVCCIGNPVKSSTIDHTVKGNFVVPPQTIDSTRIDERSAVYTSDGNELDQSEINLVEGRSYDLEFFFGVGDSYGGDCAVYLYDKVTKSQVKDTSGNNIRKEFSCKNKTSLKFAMRDDLVGDGVSSEYKFDIVAYDKDKKIVDSTAIPVKVHPKGSDVAISGIGESGGSGGGTCV
ncbi:hypothetical protein JW868_02875 [Candidatus Woesearchaeota archaeon]|nr:hypothetical protein [Candidatus Woesearchaeota archaeon]